MFFLGDDLEDVSNVTPGDMTYYFYGLKNPTEPQEIKWNNVNDLRHGHFNASKYTLILIHGYNDSAQGLLVKTVKNELLNAKQDLNIIGLDWSPIWKNNNPSDFYSKLAPKAGEYIGHFFNQLLILFDLDYSKVTIAAHSAGGPIAGAFGETVNGYVKHIVGLDTSGINKTNAHFVEVSN